MFAEYLSRWRLTPDGDPTPTHNSRLLPLRWRGAAAMLKVVLEAEEKAGNGLMAWWRGEGGARVLATDGEAILLERAEGKASLADFVQRGRDDEASRICAVVTKPHAPRTRPILPVAQWFAQLAPAAATQGGILAVSAGAARDLLASQREVAVWDIHHGNILNFGERGWLAIDPSGRAGERGFDYANLFCNPDHRTATSPRRLARRIVVVADAAGLQCKRLLGWILAWAELPAGLLRYGIWPMAHRLRRPSWWERSPPRN